MDDMSAVPLDIGGSYLVHISELGDVSDNSAMYIYDRYWKNIE